MTIEKNAGEQRSTERFNLSLPWPAAFHFGGDKLNAMIVDLSSEGMKLALSRMSMGSAIQNGFDVTLTITTIVFPPSGNETRFNATIRWVQRQEAEYVLGMQFIDPVGEKLLLELEKR